MRIAAIVTIAEERQRTGDSPAPARQLTHQNGLGAAYGHSDILGENLLARTLDRFAKVVDLPTVVLREPPRSGTWLPPRTGAYRASWEKAVAQQVEAGAEALLFARLNAYNDLDYQQLVEFHCQTASPLTRVHTEDARLDLALVNVSVFGPDPDRRALSLPVAGQRQFLYRGYVNYLRCPQDYYTLVEDGLCGRCGLKPQGTEVAPGVWYGSAAQVDPNAAIVAPVFIGAHSHISAGSTIACAAVERNCEIDYGTAVTNSWVLGNTYVGLALDVRRSLVRSQTLFHMDRNVELCIEDGGLIGSNSRTRPLLAQLESFLLGTSDH